MEIHSEQPTPVPVYDPTADVTFSNDNLEASMQISIPQEINTDEFDNESQLKPGDFYKQKVDELHSVGALGTFLQISPATDEFIKSTQKDPMSLLNVYCTVTGTPKFQFYDYQMGGCPDNNKFIMVSELDGNPIFGVLQSNKKEAKRTCAIRIIEKLMEQQRFNMISEKTGRKLKHPGKYPRPLPYSSTSILEKEQMELANLGSEYYNQPQALDPQMASFAEDIDLDKQPKMRNGNEYLEEFESKNPLPKDCKDPAQFVHIRERAFHLFCENAFWNEIKIEQSVYEKLNQCGMWSEQWNTFAFVNRCVMRANSWRKTTATNQNAPTEQAQDIKPKSPITVVNQQMAVEEKEKKEQGQQPVSFEYFTFTLPFIPARYAALVLFDGQILHGRIADSKNKARLNCANVLAIKMVELGWADLEKKPKQPKKRLVGSKTKKRKMAESVESIEDINSANIASDHQFLLTIHPMEQLDQRTHFLLATNPGKNALQLLNEIAGKQRYELKYQESHDGGNSSNSIVTVQIQPPGIPGLPRDLTGQPFCVEGVPEKNKKIAKLAAARATLDHFVKTGVISVDQQELAAFKSAIKKTKLCECCESPIEVEGKQQMAGNLESGVEMVGLSQV